MPPAVEARSLNHWTAREVPSRLLLLKMNMINSKTHKHTHPKTKDIANKPMVEIKKKKNKIYSIQNNEERRKGEKKKQRRGGKYCLKIENK